MALPASRYRGDGCVCGSHAAFPIPLRHVPWLGRGSEGPGKPRRCPTGRGAAALLRQQREFELSPWHRVTSLRRCESCT